MKEYIQNRTNLANSFHIFDVPIVIKDALPKYLDLQNIKNLVEEHTFAKYFANVKQIVIGNFKDNIDSFGIKAFYAKNVIFISNHEDDKFEVTEERVARDIVHEGAHSLLSVIPSDIIEFEFLIKKKTVLAELEVMEGVEIPSYFFDLVDYNKTFDDFLYNIVGYKLLEKYTFGLFVTPYSMTSLDEYFTEGVEEYLFGDYNYISKINPELYTLIEGLFEQLRGLR